MDDDEVAVMLSHAATFGVTAAAKEYGVNRRTIQRYQAEVRDGKNPKLSQLIAEQVSQQKKRNGDKMQRAIDVLLDRTIELAPKADMGQVVNALEKIGDLAGSWKVMGVQPHREGEEAAGDAGLGSGTAPSEGEFAPAVH